MGRHQWCILGATLTGSARTYQDHQQEVTTFGQVMEGMLVSRAPVGAFLYKSVAEGNKLRPRA